MNEFSCKSLLMENFGQIPYFLGAIQGVLLSIFLFTIRVNRLPNLFLGLLTFCWALILLQFPLQEYGLYSSYPHLLKTISLLLFLLFPLLYLNVKYLLSDFKNFDPKDLLHFSFFFIFILLYADFYILSPEEKLETIRNKSSYYAVIQLIGDEVIAIQGIVYSILVFNLLAKYKKVIKNYQSTVEGTLLKALKGGTTLIFIAWIIGSVAVNLDIFNIPVNYDLFIIVYLIIVIVIYYISYVAIYTPEVFKLDRQLMGINILSKTEYPINSIKDLEENIEEEVEPIPVIDRSKDKDLLETYMLIKEPFLQPELSLQQLAEDINFSRHQLSTLINQEYQVNFYEFVNSYRVNKVKQLISDPENSNLKIISLAYDSGFNSKASFNRIFKQVNGMTPTEYANSIK